MSSAAPRLLTFADLDALGDVAAEIVNGTLVYKADPSAEHADAQTALAAFLRNQFHRRGGQGGPGGWWILTEVDVELAVHQISTVYRLERTEYVVALQAKQGEVVHAPPFEAVALRVGLLFGEDPD